MKKNNEKKSHIITIRITGDSGDGIQLLGEQLTIIAAQSGHDVRTLPDFPAEIRAPAGTVSGISGFQLAIADNPIFTAGEKLDVLVAMNPAGLKIALEYLDFNGLLIINEDSFTEKDWKLAGLNPDSLNIKDHYQVISVPLMRNTLSAITNYKLTNTQAKQIKNFYVLGLILYLFNLPLEHAKKLIADKFVKNIELVEANKSAVLAGYNYGEILELSKRSFYIDKLNRLKGNYRQITGVEAVALALATLATYNQNRVWVAGYPITPASAILHECAKLETWGVDLFQAEDEISAICSCLGAAFGGKLAVTCTSGPGFDLKTEALGLAISTELPLVVIDVQRAGLSTGLPTKTGQSDLNCAYYGRHGEAPIPILAPSSPISCFYTIIEAFSIAVKFMTPVIVLMDAYLANCAESWLIPDPKDLILPNWQYNTFTEAFQRDDVGARSWNLPGTKGYIHQIGGLEKSGITGQISYDPVNYQNMVNIRSSKIKNITAFIADLKIYGNQNSNNLLISWGSTYGAVFSAIKNFQDTWAWIHIQHINPFNNNLFEIVKNYKNVYIVELNSGHLCKLLRSETLVDIKPWVICDGRPLSETWLIGKIQGVSCES